MFIEVVLIQCLSSVIYWFIKLEFHDLGSMKFLVTDFYSLLTYDFTSLLTAIML